MNEKLVKWLTSSSTERDEREKQELAESFGEGFIYLYIIIPTLLFINLLIDAIQHSFSVETLSLFAIFMFMSIYSLVKMRKHRLDDERVHNEEEYRKVKKRYKIRCTFVSILFVIVMSISSTYFIPMLINEEISLSIFQFISNLFFGVLSGIFCYYLLKSKIQKEYDE
ncbi:DUF3278 domain-containing protein [Staphylococcus argensis]|uniref:DUF3278 domain-containing protein n=1 Tax=Staphylococcus argensis TaxID=1607738 RepID=UPI002283E1CD|nr:DUF3278 domain-containing protein [Staphylococcus argensis]MCY6992374.1 DUF3278 domain-containing protein [Staphylococcus argensis]